MTERRQIEVSGVVQGVGFRPFVYRLACVLSLTGSVRNHAQGVTIEIEGPPEVLDRFCRELQQSPPPLSRIAGLRSVSIPARRDTAFVILSSIQSGAADTMIGPDTAVCGDCLREMCDAANRRFRYPFINCTNCGPRYTITRAIPYDRPQTTMAVFPMCPDCQREYDAPGDRRFHAQPNACPVCGPHVALHDSQNIIAEQDAAVLQAVALLEQGAILAVRSIGGFHLMCNAANETAVAELRRRKHRYEKPLALMTANMDRARAIVTLNDAEAAALESPERPIVLASRRPGAGLAPSVAPGLAEFGVMLPSAPLHYLLLEGNYPALVATSGNRSEEPIVTNNAEALQRLGDIADYFLLHNRDINTRCDDSVIRTLGGMLRPIRRARGYAPLSIALQQAGPSVLACGPEMKNTICVTRADQAFLSQHLGDLETLPAREFYTETAAHLLRILQVTPEAVAHDLHPDYAATRYADTWRERCPVLAVQHHHAHIAAVLAEHQLDGPVIGIALDGTGLGTDGTLWGGEILRADLGSFTRVGHLEPLPLPGGDQAAREPWRIAVAALTQFAGDQWRSWLPPHFSAVSEESLSVIAAMAAGDTTIRSSALGRLFDAVAALTGVRLYAGFEGQTGMELEALAAGYEQQAGSWPYEIRQTDGILELPSIACIRGVLEDLRDHRPVPEIAARFHATIIEMFASAAVEIAGTSGLQDVALSGGCFQNRVLADGFCDALRRHGLRPLLPVQAPVNDGGIALGQAAVVRQKIMNCEL